MSKQSSSGTAAGNITLLVEFSGSSLVYSLLGNAPSGPSAASSGSTRGAQVKPIHQRIYTAPRSSLLHPLDDAPGAVGGTGGCCVVPSSLSSVWNPLREVLNVGCPAPTISNRGISTTKTSIRSLVGAALGDALVQDESHALRLAKVVPQGSTTSGPEEEGAAPLDPLQQSSANCCREAVEALAGKFKLLPLTAAEVAVSEDPTIKNHINAQIAKLSSDTSAPELAGLASLAVLAPPQLSSLFASSSAKNAHCDVSVVVLLPNDPTTTPRVTRELILASIFSLDSVLLGSSSSSTAVQSSSSDHQQSVVADLVSRRFFKLPVRISKVQFAYSAVASLNACGLHSGSVCHVEAIPRGGNGNGAQQQMTVSFCAVSNAQPVLPLCRTISLPLNGPTASGLIRQFAGECASRIHQELLLDVPAIHCSKLPTPSTPATAALHPLAHSQNTTGLDASSLKDLTKHFIVKVSSGGVGDVALGREFAASFSSLVSGPKEVALGSKRSREENDAADEEVDTSSFVLSSPMDAARTSGWCPKEVSATSVPTLIEVVHAVATSTPSNTGGVEYVSRTVISSSAIQAADRLAISAVLGATVLVQLTAYDSYFTVTAAQFKQEGPAVSVTRVPLDSR